MRYIDHLGRLPASVYNKTAAAVDAVKWVQDSLSVIVPGAENFYRSFTSSETYGFKGIENPCNPNGYQFNDKYLSETAVGKAGTGIEGTITITSTPLEGESTTTVSPWDFSGNHFSQSATALGTSMGPPGRSVEMMTTGALFGFPNILATIPDGTEILDAKCEVTVSGATGYRTRHDNTCSGSGTTIGIEDMQLQVALVAVYPNGEIGGLGGGGLPSGDPNRTSVINCKDLIEAMYNLKYSNALGFCAYVTPENFDLALPAVPNIGWCPGENQDCDDIHVTSYFDMRIEWSNISFGNLFIKLKYPDEEKTRIITPHWPVLD